jgi:hypothetical protein
MSLVVFTAGQVLTAADLNNNFSIVTPGLVRMIPSTVTVTGAGSSASVDAEGRITFATAATVSINDCFTAAYTNYRVLVDYDVSAADADNEIRLRVAGTDNTTASSYNFQHVNASSTTVAGARTASSAARLGQGASSTATNSLVMEFFRPYLADTTNYTALGSGTVSNAYYRHTVGMHNQNTGYDGFTLTVTTGSMTGKISVFGYSE